MAIEVVAQMRKGQGRGASRRLRHSGKVPGVLYGGKKPAVNIELEHNPLYHQMRNEKFHASVLTLALDGAKESVLLRAVNMHPFKLEVQHVDFQRVSADEKIHIKVPLHFVNAEKSPAIKEQGGLITHVLSEIDVRCLPADLPEFIEVDLSAPAIGHSIHGRVASPEGQRESDRRFGADPEGGDRRGRGARRSCRGCRCRSRGSPRACCGSRSCRS